VRGTRKSVNLIVVALFLICLALPASQAKAAGNWEWTLIPYLWATSVSMDMTVNNDPVLGGEASFGDLFDKVDYAGQVHFEGRRDKGGFLVDLTFIQMGKETTIQEGIELHPDIELTILEVGGFYRPSGASDGFDWLFGVRMTDIDQEVQITLPLPPQPSTQVGTSATLVDGFLGFRYFAPIAEKWRFGIRGDVGAGDSELTWNAIASFGYRFGRDQRYALLFGWRTMVMEFEEQEDNTRTNTDLTMSGPILGFRIAW
jgi:hypothetical protein